MKRKTKWALAIGTALVLGLAVALSLRHETRTTFSSRVKLLARLKPVKSNTRFFAGGPLGTGHAFEGLVEEYEVPLDTEKTSKALLADRNLDLIFADNGKSPNEILICFSVKGASDIWTVVSLKREGPQQTRITVSGERELDAIDRFFARLRGVFRR